MLASGAEMHHIVGMARLSVTLTLPQKGWLQREAKRLGITVGELLRRIVDEKRESK